MPNTIVTVTFRRGQIASLRKLMRYLLWSHMIGWFILATFADPLPAWNFSLPIWKGLSYLMIGLTFWLGLSLSIKALYVWAITASVVAVFRAGSFILVDTYNALGVWLLLVSGILLTSLTVVSINVLTGHMKIKTPIKLVQDK